MSPVLKINGMHCSGQSRTWESGSAEISGIVGYEWMEFSYSL